MWGFITHFSSPKSSTACTTALKKNPNTLGFAPSLTKILDRRAQLFLAFRRFPTTTRKLSSESDMIRLKYLKGVIDSNGLQ